ncbi:TetR family transcriptional regulator [Herbaspirillum rubrisubalbicans]|jgi:AcrR family transcriptional regulator|uniref:TetR family transcriptional regulator n=2 Tax=Herbaspirillum rubrisubalbicans TaxID=80842 RepID=A0ABX9C3N6_9BURK|nr:MULTISPECIES: TetR/AcrR family transcriptional regulator [Herbaspirillum]MCP1576476.1 AcrR family transcriptional regulator [Herbaspirillum rubrisubalbicans]NQE49963.1 TetR family transcriptional regulator [Herbaspirillum rubrisubalbicans]QJP99710.1 TetR/AcrR family transcriptional regulator [Herbaspirillum rubrisubalbicans Os34]RAM65154.1 TetR family transcriptional regulator [Herbaspirillum rubrisubalbicans]RAN48786.1 TetR family transcriptional regulator [Herbaspirillum rubrisubalbicans]
MSPASPKSPRQKPDLSGKKQPAQQRATETYEHILTVTAQMLEEVGVERFSTNLVCERAGITPPALYRYFPNKYALLSELGQRLMQRQNELIPKWITHEVLTGSGDELERALTGLILDTHRVTKRTPGGVWILRALRAVPALQQVRLNSHALVTETEAQLLLEAFPNVPPRELMVVGRVAVDMIYAAVELLFDVSLSRQSVAKVVASMIASHLTPLRDR